MIYNITIIGNKLHFQTQLDSSPAFWPHSCAFLFIPVSFLCIPVSFLSHSCVFLSHSCRFRSHSCGFLWIPAESRNSGRNLWGSEKYWLDYTKFNKECQFCDGFDNDNCPL